MGVTYIFPNGPKAPTQAQMEKKFHAVHVQVSLADADLPVDVVHNFQFVMEPPDAKPENAVFFPEYPLVIVNPISGGATPPLWSIAYKDGNTLTVGKLATGPGTSLVLDIWIYRHRPMSTSIFGGY